MLPTLGAATAAATFPGANGKLTFTRTVGGFSDLWLMDPDGQNQTLIAGDPTTYEHGSSFSADGERIAFTMSLSGGADGIVVMSVDGSDPALITADASDFGDPSFSPDGRQVVYQTLNEDIAIVDVDGQNRRLLTSGPARDFEPSFSPDGGRVVFTRADGTGINVWSMDADGQSQAPLIAGPNDQSSPSFSPDGSLVAYVQAPPGDMPGDVYVADSATGQNPQQLTNTPAVHDGGPVFSPDGLKIAFAQAPSGGASDAEIVVMDAGGQNPTAVTGNSDFDNQVDWQPLNPPGCSLTGESESRSVKEVVVTVLCLNENAIAEVAGELTARTPTSAPAVTSKKKHIPLPPASAAVPQGAATSIALVIPKKGKRVLKRSGKAGKAAVTVSLSDDLGQSATLSQTIKVKPKKK